MPKKTKPTPPVIPTKRAYISQTDVPNNTIDEALRIPRALADSYAGGPASPLQVAHALNMTPTSGSFRNLCGSAIAYGLTQGGYNAKEIILEPLGKRIVQPLEDDDDTTARREAVLKPRVLGDFIRKYNNSPIPRREIGLNVLTDMGVPRERCESVYTLILDTASSVGFIREIKGKQFIDLTGMSLARPSEPHPDTPRATPAEPTSEVAETAHRNTGGETPPVSAVSSVTTRRVFITHGKNTAFIEPIKKLLGFGELIPIVSVERQSVSKPVPEKVMDDMRSCGAAIIHVDAEETLIDKEATERSIINPNVLIEIGAAMALYGRRFILLVREGVTLPSNLQGLYEVRYSGDVLDGSATIRLLEAINDIKNHPLPDRYAPTAKEA